MGAVPRGVRNRQAARTGRAKIADHATPQIVHFREAPNINPRLPPRPATGRPIGLAHAADPGTCPATKLSLQLENQGADNKTPRDYLASRGNGPPLPRIWSARSRQEPCLIVDQPKKKSQSMANRPVDMDELRQQKLRSKLVLLGHEKSAGEAISARSITASPGKLAAGDDDLQSAGRGPAAQSARAQGGGTSRRA